jgi:hypothetical protein
LSFQLIQGVNYRGKKLRDFKILACLLKVFRYNFPLFNPHYLEFMYLMVYMILNYLNDMQILPLYKLLNTLNINYKQLITKNINF